MWCARSERPDIESTCLPGKLSANSSRGECPRQDSNLRTALRRRVLYPLSYEGVLEGECSNDPSAVSGAVDPAPRGGATPTRRADRPSFGLGRWCPMVPTPVDGERTDALGARWE